MTTFDEPFEGLRYVVETKRAGRGGKYAVVAVLADYGDAVYVADARFHDGENFRVCDVETSAFVYEARH